MQKFILTTFFMFTTILVSTAQLHRSNLPTTNRPSSAESIPLFPQISEGKINTSSFGRFMSYLHPCGIAISKTNAIAICTYENFPHPDIPTSVSNDRSSLTVGGKKSTNGHIFIWKSISDFSSKKQADYHYVMNTPEAVAFDNSGTLYISSPEMNRIYYMSNLAAAPTKYFELNATQTNNASNPRGMVFDSINILYVMCENIIDITKKSYIVKVTSPWNDRERNMSVLLGSDQKKNNALGVSLSNDSRLYTTDLNSNEVNEYNLLTNSVIKTKTLSDASSTMDVLNNGNVTYFTNIAGGNANLVQWNSTNNETKYINLGTTEGNYTAWGMAKYRNYIILTDAPRHQVRILKINNINWQ